MKKLLSIVRIIILIVIAITLAIIPSCKGKEPKTIEKFEGRAVSLKVLQYKVKDCMEKGTCPENILQLCDIKKVLGYVIDGKNNDIILLGNIDDSMPPLYLEDFVIALRNTWMMYAELKGNTYYYSNPICSIDPDPRILSNLQQIANQIFSSSNPERVQRNLKQWHSVCDQPQGVRVLGIPYDTRFGKVMVDADYYMKRLVDGSVTLDIDGFTSLTDMTLNIAREDIEKGNPVSVPLSSLNRFWFYPGENSFFEDKGVIYIKRSDVRLLTEEEFLTKRGEVAGTGRPNPLAQKFAESFSTRYAEIAKRKPIYAELEGLFRFVALARIMKHRNTITEAGIDLDYLMNQYPIERTLVDRTLPGISNVKEFNYRSETQGGYSVLYLWLPSCGGVSIDIDIKNSSFAMDRSGSIGSMRKGVLNARPSPDTLYWDFLTISKVSSSPMTKRKTVPQEKIKESKDIPTALTRRLEDIKEASQNLKNGIIIDLFIEEKNIVHGNIVDASGSIHKIDSETSKELRKLLNITATTHGKLGNSLIARWQKFCNTYLLPLLSKTTIWTCPDGRTVKIKPDLIIKSNEVNYKYANLEKVPALADNFIIFIASKETLVKDLVAKINNIPKLTKRNVAFIIRLPDMNKNEQGKWYKEINNLQKLIGKNNVLLDPSKEEFERMLQKRDKDIVVIELTHTDRGILLKNNERYTSKDIGQSGDLSHIKYLISGIGTCNLPRLEDGKFAASLRGKGVGIINASYREVSSETALEKLRELINILRNIEKYDLYPYHLIDIIDQRLGISGEGTTNLGKREQGRDYFLG